MTSMEIEALSWYLSQEMEKTMRNMDELQLNQAYTDIVRMTQKITERSKE